MLPPPLYKEATSIRGTNWFEVTSNLTWVNVNVERRIVGAGSPQTTVVAASEGDVGENWKLEAKRKPIGLKSVDGGSLQYHGVSM